MSAGKFDIVLEQGVDYTLEVTYQDDTGTPINLSGYTAKLQVRTAPTSATAIISLTESDGLTLGTSDGTIDILIPAASTALLGADFVGVYDLVLNSGSELSRLMQGKVTVSPGVVK